MLKLRVYKQTNETTILVEADRNSIEYIKDYTTILTTSPKVFGEIVFDDYCHFDSAAQFIKDLVILFDKGFTITIP